MTTTPETRVLKVGRLATVNDDTYPGLGAWLVQVWQGDGDDANVYARAYGDTPALARERAELIAAPVAAKANIDRVIAQECAAGAACGWRSCTGCHETCEGQSVGDYTRSEVFGCEVGSGCTECGGLGVVWEYWTRDSLDAMAEESAPVAASAVDVLRDALHEALTWHQSEDKALSKSGRTDNEYHWRRAQHGEQQDLINEALAATQSSAAGPA